MMLGALALVCVVSALRVGHESGQYGSSGKIHKDVTQQLGGQTLLRVEQPVWRNGRGLCHVRNVAPVVVKVAFNGGTSKTLQPGESWQYMQMSFVDHRYFDVTAGGFEIAREGGAFELTAESKGEAVGTPTRETWLIQLTGDIDQELVTLAYAQQPELFIQGDENTNACPSDSHRVVDLSICKAAARQIGVAFHAVSSRTLPKGCYIPTRTPSWWTGPWFSGVYFNVDWIGGPSNPGKPICFTQGALVEVDETFDD